MSQIICLFEKNDTRLIVDLTICSNKDDKKVDGNEDKDVSKSAPIEVPTIAEGYVAEEEEEEGDLISSSPLSNATSVTEEGDDGSSTTEEETELQNESKRAVLQHVLQEHRNEDNTVLKNVREMI